jgi:hypothetical protein
LELPGFLPSENRLSVFDDVPQEPAVRRPDLDKLTRAPTAGVNGGTRAVLRLVDAVTKHNPTTV